MNDFYEAVKLSINFLNLPDNWDNQGAKRLSTNVLNKALYFLFKLTQEINKDKELVSQWFEINLCPSGSLDLSWRYKDVRGLVNISDIHIKYYFDCNDTKIEGSYNEENNFNELYNFINKYLTIQKTI